MRWEAIVPGTGWQMVKGSAGAQQASRHAHWPAAWVWPWGSHRLAAEELAIVQS